MHNYEPEFLSLSLLMKAVPHSEGPDRFVYCIASDENKDLQGEVILQKSLSDSMQYFLMRGNCDIDHISMTGAKLGIKDYLMYEIGRPIEVKLQGTETLVKAQIYSGDGIAAEKANQFWSSLTEISPPARWHPSVGGSITNSEIVIDPKTQERTRKINAVRWSNIGFSRQPINQNVPVVSTIPMQVFCKSFVADGFYKALEAGYGTDISQLTGGAALRKQSLAGYPAYRDKVSRLFLDGAILAKNIIPESVTRFGLSHEDAETYATKFLNEIKRGKQS